MILNLIEIDEVLEIKENLSLVLESPKRFYDVVQSIKKNCLGTLDTIAAFEDKKEIDFKKCCEIVYDFFDLTLNSKKFLAVLQKQFKELATDDLFYLRTQEILGNLEKYFFDMSFEFDSEIEMEENFNISSVIKMLGVKFLEKDNLLDKLLEFFKISSEFFGTKLVVLVNPENVFENNEILEIVNCAKYLKMKLLIIRNEFKGKIFHEPVIIVDNDDCIIYK